MKIVYKQGNLLDCEEPVIVHGVNCKGVMGSGVAKAIRDKWPIAYREYKSYCALHSPEDCLGRIVICTGNGKELDWDKYIIHAFIQLNFGRDSGTTYVSYDALRSCFKDITNEIKSSTQTTTMKVAMPKIGAGLANGDWDTISKIIEEESGHVWQPVVYVV